MSAMASQITGVSIAYSAFCSDGNQRKRQSSASLAFVRGNHRWPVNSPHKGPVMRKMFSFHDVIINRAIISPILPTSHILQIINALWRSDATLAQVKVCRLFGVKPLSEQGWNIIWNIPMTPVLVRSQEIRVSILTSHFHGWMNSNIAHQHCLALSVGC